MAAIPRASLPPISTIDRSWENERKRLGVLASACIMAGFDLLLGFGFITQTHHQEPAKLCCVVVVVIGELSSSFFLNLPCALFCSAIPFWLPLHTSIVKIFLFRQGTNQKYPSTYPPCRTYLYSCVILSLFITPLVV